MYDGQLLAVVYALAIATYIRAGMEGDAVHLELHPCPALVRHHGLVRHGRSDEAQAHGWSRIHVHHGKRLRLVAAQRNAASAPVNGEAQRNLPTPNPRLGRDRRHVGVGLGLAAVTRHHMLHLAILLANLGGETASPVDIVHVATIDEYRRQGLHMPLAVLHVGGDQHLAVAPHGDAVQHHAHGDCHLTAVGRDADIAQRDIAVTVCRKQGEAGSKCQQYENESLFHK